MQQKSTSKLLRQPKEKSAKGNLSQEIGSVGKWLACLLLVFLLADLSAFAHQDRTKKKRKKRKAKTTASVVNTSTTQQKTASLDKAAKNEAVGPEIMLEKTMDNPKDPLEESTKNN